ncbi:replication protein RepA [Arenicella sp. 4NH20-0111]|uniref:replication protein RepA n=1 Tax=Arenicella sp. 4NH20-0111 TaxID=3127648 RepID=UPI0031066371
MSHNKMTRHQKRLIEGAGIIQMNSAYQAGSIAYMPTILIRATMPHSETSARIFERVDGRLKVTYADVNGVGLPYGGLPRIIMAWIATEVILTKSKRIDIDGSLSEFLRGLSMTSTGGKKGSIKRVKKQFVSLFSCSIGHNVTKNGCQKIETLALATRQQYWWTPIAPETVLLKKSFIELSQEFYNQILESSAPIDMRALNLLKGSPLAMDIYVWLTYKMSIITEPVTISWPSLKDQIGVGYAADKKGLNRFQEAFKKHLMTVRIIYPTVNIELLYGRIRLLPSPPHVSKIRV